MKIFLSNFISNPDLGVALIHGHLLLLLLHMALLLLLYGQALLLHVLLDRSADRTRVALALLVVLQQLSRRDTPAKTLVLSFHPPLFTRFLTASACIGAF